MRLVTDLDPTTIPEANPVKAEAIDVDALSEQVPLAEHSWASQQKWYQRNPNLLILG